MNETPRVPTPTPTELTVLLALATLISVLTLVLFTVAIMTVPAFRSAMLPPVQFLEYVLAAVGNGIVTAARAVASLF